MNLLLGDSYWGLGNLDSAASKYERLRTSRLNAAYDEAVSIRLQLLAATQHGSVYQSYFTRHLSDSGRIEFLTQLLSSNAQIPSMTRFLLGRELMGQKAYHLAWEHLHQVSGFESPVLDFLLHMRQGRSLFAMRDFQRAKMHFWNALNFTTDQFRILNVREWIARCEWSYERTQKGPTANASPVLEQLSIH